MSIDVEKMLDEAVKKMTEAYNSINDYAIEIGVIAADNKRTTMSVGINNAELMFIHENGSPLRNLPARPVLQLTIEDALKKLLPDTINRIYDGCFKNSWTIYLRWEYGDGASSSYRLFYLGDLVQVSGQDYYTSRWQEARNTDESSATFYLYYMKVNPLTGK